MKEESLGINSGHGESMLRTTIPNLFTSSCKKEMMATNPGGTKALSALRLEI